MSTSQSFDISKLPKSYRENLKESHHTPDQYSPELRALLDPNIVARRVNLPLTNMFEIINREYVYHLARRIMGKSADHNNYKQLLMQGYSNATCKPGCEDTTGKCGCDVHPLVAEATGDGTEITVGTDLVLVKARPDVHYGRQKTYLQKALNMTNPGMAVGALPMEDQAALAGTFTRVPSVEDQERISSRATPENSIRRGTPQWNKIAKTEKENS
jgi:hypothetical protein